jgi:hypothetical protein
MSDILEDCLFLVVQDNEDVVQVGPLRNLLPCAARDDNWGASQTSQHEDDKKVANEMDRHQVLPSRGGLDWDSSRPRSRLGRRTFHTGHDLRLIPHIVN